MKNSPHFKLLDEIASFDESTTFSNVSAQLNKQEHKGGFILLEGSQPKAYIKAFELAKGILQASKESHELQEFSITSIGELANNYPSAVIEIPNTPEDFNHDENDLQNQPDAVFLIQQNTDNIGWYLNHEGLVGTLTERVIYECQNTPSHFNYSFGNGNCSQCPFPLDRVINTAGG